MGHSIFQSVTLFCPFPSTNSLGKGRIEKRKMAAVAKFLIANINNKATGMLNKSEPIEAYPSEGFR